MVDHPDLFVYAGRDRLNTVRTDVESFVIDGRWQLSTMVLHLRTTRCTSVCFGVGATLQQGPVPCVPWTGVIYETPPSAPPCASGVGGTGSPPVCYPLDRMSTTKFPLPLVLMEVAAQLGTATSSWDASPEPAWASA